MIIGRIFSIGHFSAANQVCSLISIRVGPLYIISSWFSYSQLKFSYFGLMGSRSFNDSFVEAFHEDLGMISILPMLVDLQATFAMLLLCYAQCPNYLFHIMFPSLNIL
jgi:hypothetical protein